MKNEAKALIIVDGKTISNEEMKKINPENIESVSVFKDEAALAKYGEKGKYGVVIIQTKAKDLVIKDLPVTITGDTSTEHLTLNGNIKIRGNSLQDPGTQPLYVINGKIKTGKINLDSINPDEIESINVIKGTNALQKYGEAAKNGVIEITTKSQKKLKVIPITGNPGNNKLEGVSAIVIPPTENYRNSQGKIKITTPSENNSSLVDNNTTANFTITGRKANGITIHKSERRDTLTNLLNKISAN